MTDAAVRLLALLLLHTCILTPKFINGRLTITPQDKVILMGELTYFNCSTSGFEVDIHWYFYPYAVGSDSPPRENVYSNGELHSSYDGRFRIDDSPGGVCNLVIVSVKVQDAGKYECQDNKGSGESKSAQLTVLGSNPVCETNPKSGGIVGPNNCGIEPEYLTLSCGITYRGKDVPTLAWRQVGEYYTFDITGEASSVSFNRNGSFLQTGESRSILANLQMNNSTFVCQTARSASTQYKCTTDITNVIYAFNSNLTMNATLDDQIICYANSSQKCLYKWKWFQDDNSTSESTDAILKPNKEGWHRCEAQCNIRQRPCQISVMTAFVSGRRNLSSIELNSYSYWIFIVVVLVVVILSSLLTGICIRKRINKRRGELKHPEKRAASGEYDFIQHDVIDGYDAIDNTKIEEDAPLEFAPRDGPLPSPGYSQLMPMIPVETSGYSQLEHDEMSEKQTKETLDSDINKSEDISKQKEDRPLYLSLIEDNKTSSGDTNMNEEIPSVYLTTSKDLMQTNCNQFSQDKPLPIQELESDYLTPSENAEICAT